jgi:hypothetical protein
MRWAEQVVRIGKMRNKYKIMVEILKGGVGVGGMSLEWILEE